MTLGDFDWAQLVETLFTVLATSGAVAMLVRRALSVGLAKAVLEAVVAAVREKVEAGVREQLAAELPKLTASVAAAVRGELHRELHAHVDSHVRAALAETQARLSRVEGALHAVGVLPAAEASSTNPSTPNPNKKAAND